jgi:hypothetical protein
MTLRGPRIYPEKDMGGTSQSIDDFIGFARKTPSFRAGM